MHHSVRAVSTTVFCILHPRMDSGKYKPSKQVKKTSFNPLAFFFPQNINGTFYSSKTENNIVTKDVYCKAHSVLS